MIVIHIDTRTSTSTRDTYKHTSVNKITKYEHTIYIEPRLPDKELLLRSRLASEVSVDTALEMVPKNIIKHSIPQTTKALSSIGIDDCYTYRYKYKHKEYL